MITEANINVLDIKTDVLLSCCNCFCTMGAGVALAIRQKYPLAYSVDCQTLKGDKNKLGTISFAEVTGNTKFVINLYGQYRYGRESRHLNYEAFYCGLEKVREFCLKNSLQKVAIPYKIGCNLAGGNWNIVLTIIKEVLGGLDVVICKI